MTPLPRHTQRRLLVALATAVMAVAGVVYGLGAPAWVMYAAIVVAVLAALPGYERWERSQHPR